MWTYEQKTGSLYHNGALIGEGYSGLGADKNVPEDQNVEGKGPIPQGTYTIGEPFDTTTHGPHVMRLIPSADDKMYGRAGFLMHGDSTVHPGAASQGCIIMNREVRNTVSSSSDHDLTVTA
jgi:hypothetical protein